MNNFSEAMGEVLRQSRYDKLTGRSLDLKKILMDALEHFVRFLLDLFDITLPDWDTKSASILTNIFLVVSVLLLLIIAGFIIRLFLKKRRKRVSSPLADIFEEIRLHNYTPDEWLRQSRTFAEESQWREAVRYQFIAALVAIHEKRILRIDKSETNAQLQKALVSASPDLAPHFGAAVDAFHTVWFGYKPWDAAQYERLSDHVKTIVNAEAPHAT